MDKILWHTITIRVPKEMVNISNGRVSVGNTLTKTNNISKRQKQPSIKLIPSNDNQPHIIADGKEWNLHELKERVKKSNDLAKKNQGRELTRSGRTHVKEFEGRVKKHATHLVDSRLGIDPNIKGYSWNNQKQKFQARIKINQRIRHLGFFDNEEDAHNAYLVAKREVLRT